MFVFISLLRWCEWGKGRMESLYNPKDPVLEVVADQTELGLLLLSIFLCLFFPFVQTLFEGSFALTQ